MPELIVTTSRHSPGGLVGRAREWALRLNAPYLPRSSMSLEELAAAQGAVGVLVVSADRVTYQEPASGWEYFFHPNLARMRITSLREGPGDPMISAMQLKPGDSVLDCTLGRGTDAIICSWVVGEGGRVVGLEKQPVIAQLAIEGLGSFPEKSRQVREAMRRVQPIQADHAEWLPQQPAGSFEVVYFDPVFDQPVDTSLAIQQLRRLAAEQPLTAEALAQGRRVARRRVVVKQRRCSPLWQSFPPDELITGRLSRIEFGVFGAT